MMLIAFAILLSVFLFAALMWRSYYVNVPSWLFVRLSDRFLPNGHPFKGRDFTYRDWNQGATFYTKQFSVTMWAVAYECLVLTLAKFTGVI